MLEHDISTQGFSGKSGFHDSSIEDEEIIFRGRLANGGNPVGASLRSAYGPIGNHVEFRNYPTETKEPGLPIQKDDKLHNFGLSWSELKGKPTSLRSADGPIGNHVEFRSYPTETKEPGLPIQKDDKLHPLGLSWSELKGKPTRNNQPSSISSTTGMPGHLLGHSPGMVYLFGGVPDQNVEETWSNFYNKGPISNSNMFRESLDGQHFAHVDHHEIAQQVIYGQLQKQHNQPRNMVSQLTHLNESPLLQVSDRASLYQKMANQPLSKLEHILALEQQQQQQLEIQQDHLQQQFQKNFMQKQHAQARQLPLEQLFHGRDLDFAQSLIDPNTSLDQILVKQHLPHDSQTYLHQPSRRSNLYLEQLIKAKMGHATNQDRQTDLLKLMQQTMHEKKWSLQMLHQEQLQAQQFRMGLRQQYKIREGRPIGSAWSVDEAHQFLLNPVGSQRAHSAALSPPYSHLDMLSQQRQRAHQVEQLRETEQILQKQEGLKRGLCDPGMLPFEWAMSLQGGGPGVNLEMDNAIARLQGLDIQDPNGHMQSAVQLSSLSSGQHPFIRDEFNTSHFDDEGCWPDNDSRMSNDWMDPHLQHLHLNSKQQQLDEDNSKKLLMKLLHQKSSHQPTQSLYLKDGAPLEWRTSGLLTGGIDISGRLNGLSNAGMVMEGESIYPGINLRTSLRYNNADMSGNYNMELSEMWERNWAPSTEDMAKGSVMEDSVLKKAGVAALDGRETPAGSFNREDSIGVAARKGEIYNEKTGLSYSFTEDVGRISKVLSRDLENVSSKHLHVPHLVSSQEGICDLVIDADTKNMSSIDTLDGGRIDLGRNATVQACDNSTTRKDKLFR